MLLTCFYIILFISRSANRMWLLLLMDRFYIFSVIFSVIEWGIIQDCVGVCWQKVFTYFNRFIHFLYQMTCRKSIQCSHYEPRVFAYLTSCWPVNLLRFSLSFAGVYVFVVPWPWLAESYNSDVQVYSRNHGNRRWCKWWSAAQKDRWW